MDKTTNVCGLLAPTLILLGLFFFEWDQNVYFLLLGAGLVCLFIAATPAVLEWLDERRQEKTLRRQRNDHGH
ncbi:MAG: hypothetical protein ACR2RB_02245 [Gammaproteobacteria bacterium]